MKKISNDRNIHKRLSQFFSLYGKLNLVDPPVKHRNLRNHERISRHKSLHPKNAISGSGIWAVCRSVIRNYLGPWIVARVRFWGVQQDFSLSLSLPRFFPRASSSSGSAKGGGGSMVRGTRILRVTRVAARLDCLQRLSNWRMIQEKQTISTNWRDRLM